MLTVIHSTIHFDCFKVLNGLDISEDLLVYKFCLDLFDIEIWDKSGRDTDFFFPIIVGAAPNRV